MNPANATADEDDEFAKRIEGKSILTTGEAAVVMRCSLQTVIRCYDSGKLKGYKVPGSKFRRIPRAWLLQFLRTNNMPTDLLIETRGQPGAMSTSGSGSTGTTPNEGRA